MVVAQRWEFLSLDAMINKSCPDNVLLRYEQVSKVQTPKLKDCESIRNWVYCNKPIVRSESNVYLDSVEDDDFVSSSGGQCRDRGVVEALFEAAMHSCPRTISSVRTCPVQDSQSSCHPLMFQVSHRGNERHYFVPGTGASHRTSGHFVQWLTINTSVPASVNVNGRIFCSNGDGNVGKQI